MFLHEQFFCFVRSPFVAVPLGRSRYLKSKIETEKKEKRLLQPVVVPAVIVRTEKGVKIPGMRVAECSLRCIGLDSVSSLRNECQSRRFRQEGCFGLTSSGFRKVGTVL